jgi:hypothetical protein
MVSPLFFNTLLELPFQPHVGVRETDHKGFLVRSASFLHDSSGILLVHIDSLPSRMIPRVSGYSWTKFQIWTGRYRALSWRMLGRRQGPPGTTKVVLRVPNCKQGPVRAILILIWAIWATRHCPVNAGGFGDCIQVFPTKAMAKFNLKEGTSLKAWPHADFISWTLPRTK